MAGSASIGVCPRGGVILGGPPPYQNRASELAEPEGGAPWLAGLDFFLADGSVWTPTPELVRTTTPSPPHRPFGSFSVGLPCGAERWDGDRRGG